MATSKDYLAYVLDLLRDVSGISYKYMMGEYVLYKDSVIFGGIYDNRFLVKKTKSIEEYGFKEAIPYPKGSSMYLIDIENPDEIREIVNKIYKDLKK